MYYIPKLKSNIISLGQSTEGGCNVRMKEDYLTLYNKDRNRIVKATRSRNHLYKVLMKIEGRDQVPATTSTKRGHKVACTLRTHRS